MEIRSVSNLYSLAQIIPDRSGSNVTNNENRALTAMPAEYAGAIVQPTEVPSMQILDQTVRSINNMLQGLSQNIEFSIDQDSARAVVKIVDQQTGEVLRQLPSEEAIDIAKALDRLQGLLIHQKA